MRKKIFLLIFLSKIQLCQTDYSKSYDDYFIMCPQPTMNNRHYWQQCKDIEALILLFKPIEVKAINRCANWLNDGNYFQKAIAKIQLRMQISTHYMIIKTLQSIKKNRLEFDEYLYNSKTEGKWPVLLKKPI
jgi:hypothetical protein